MAQLGTACGVFQKVQDRAVVSPNWEPEIDLPGSLFSSFSVVQGLPVLTQSHLSVFLIGRLGDPLALAG